MPDNPVQQSVNDGSIASINQSGVSSVKGLGGMTEYEVAQPLFETENTPLEVEKLPSVEISPTIESKEQVIEEAQKSDAQITNKSPENSPHIVNKATGEELMHHLRTPDTLTTIADDDEAEFIEEVEHHAHVH